MSQLQEQQEAAVEAVNAERELSLVMSRLEDFSAKVVRVSTASTGTACARSSTPSFAASRSIATASRWSSGSRHRTSHPGLDRVDPQGVPRNIVRTATRVFDALCARPNIARP